MLIQLGGRALKPFGATEDKTFIGRIRQRDEGSETDRATAIWLTDSWSELPSGYRAYLVLSSEEPSSTSTFPTNVYQLGRSFSYLAHDDVVRIEPERGAIHALYRRSSPSNFFLVTERCDNFCVMCSQPPKKRDDSWLVDELMEVVPLVHPDTTDIGITGGEPTLLGERLVQLLQLMKRCLPRTGVHMLSNGRNFAKPGFAQAVADVAHPDFMIGIPLYGEVPEVHDYVVQASGAFDETLRGILNLKNRGVRVEIRFVIHADTYRHLPEFARFLARNLVFVDHVALMGLELMGFAKANLDALWIDPMDYQEELRAAVDILRSARVPFSIYNHQLCVLDRRLHRYAKASISDWKNLYVAECDSCSARETCGGFFVSAEARRSRGISPLVG